MICFGTPVRVSSKEAVSSLPIVIKWFVVLLFGWPASCSSPLHNEPIFVANQSQGCLGIQAIQRVSPAPCLYLCRERDRRSVGWAPASGAERDARRSDRSR